ncbi:PD-(D/E)XK motif protein [Hyphomicrobium sp. LHD-15]|uniref:PD-(D/E)XK motif protein n=1 Tax=Hyphomicrobium sp. LHD-15 TaxID=3072142 RepID=UPI00280D4468|nr:PD-(D/E)XK motif protein [Hyphomicrobium sp. LHD-15]MDQ8698167.1 PD-(D/E)XK motif protein [Hyphomicrobium sp. LHD-15]
MSRQDEPQRHLSIDGFSEYLAAGAPSALKIDGEPVVYISFDPNLPRLTLRTPLGKQSIPDLSGYDRISASSVYWNDGQWCELRLDGEIIKDAYPIFCSIADRIQLRAMNFGGAVVDALGSLRELLSGKGRLSHEQEIGLYGEVLLVCSLLSTMPASEVLASWRGPEAEEHDFTLHFDDVEVKCTTAEERAHWVNGFRQLEPTVGRKLWLLSVQLTAAGSSGTSLAELVAQTRSLLADPALLRELDQKLALLNWRDDSAALYGRRYRLRSLPRLFQIDDGFPALTPSRFESAGLAHERVSQIRYQIDLEGLPGASEFPRELTNFCAGGEFV